MSRLYAIAASQRDDLLAEALKLNRRAIAHHEHELEELRDEYQARERELLGAIERLREVAGG